MTQVTPESALAFVESVARQRADRGGLQGFARTGFARRHLESSSPQGVAPADAAPTPARFVPDATKDQAAIAGSEIVAFVKGVSEEHRQDIINCSLFAERYADDKVADPDHVFEWYDYYFEALRKLNWAIRENESHERVATEEGIDVQKAALELAATLLGPGASGLQVLEGTLSALEDMNPDSDWITLYRQNSERTKTVKMQLAVAEMDPQDGLTVSLMIFGLSATQRVTQIVFFKFSGAGLHMKHRASKFVPSLQYLDTIRDPVAKVLDDGVLNFVWEVSRGAAR